MTQKRCERPTTDRSAPVLDRRRAGVLLHPTSLPSGFLDTDAERFIDWLVRAGFSAWQMLPVGPPGPAASPYSARSAFAGFTGLLSRDTLSAPIDRNGFAAFCEQEQAWLDDYALFCVIRADRAGRPWWQWPAPLRDRKRGALRDFSRSHAEALRTVCADQYRFARSWVRLREAAAERDVQLIGDLPMFVVGDSADAWAQPELFRLDARGLPLRVAGVPPDAFAERGQCWNNPVYDWNRLVDCGFDWWHRRVKCVLSRFDLVRWDHFRGLIATWEIPVDREGRAAPASEGCWQPVPGRRLLERLSGTLGRLPFIAENLGAITPEVETLRRDFGLPGIHVLQFAFDGSSDNPHLVSNHERQGMACTGTHDNDTTLGWWQALDEAARTYVRQSLGDPMEPMPDALIDAALGSRSLLSMIPLQDLLRLGSEARMNRPGVAEGQWRWRAEWHQLGVDLTRRWRERSMRANRI